LHLQELSFRQHSDVASKTLALLNMHRESCIAMQDT